MSPDREKIIKAYEDYVNSYMPVTTCGDYILEMHKAVLSLLKEQEAVMPKVSSVEQRCGNCNKIIEMDGWKSCPWCGKSIDWERWWSKNGTYDNA